MKTQKIVSKTGFKKEMLESLRVQGGHSMTDLAQSLDVNLSTVSLWESGDRRPSPKKLRNIAAFFKVPISTFFLLVLMTLPAHAAIDRNAAITAIVGEAANQGFDGMTAVGEVIRNRGSVKGFYGYKAMKKRTEPERVWKQAEKAWDRSKTSDLTHGATLMENIEAFGFPKSWDRTKVVGVARVGDHTFFTEE